MSDLKAAAQQALEALEGFVRFAAIHSDGPDASDKYLAEDYAEEAFLKAAKVLPDLRAALAQQEPPEQPIDYFAVQRIANERGLDYNRFAAALRDYAGQAQQEQEPVAWMVTDKDGRHFIFRINKPVISEGETLTPLYTHPPRDELKQLNQ
jgi:hypothetical protein